MRATVGTAKLLSMRKKYTKEQWADCRLRYEAGEPVELITAPYGMDKGVLYAKASKEQWSRKLVTSIDQRTNSLLAELAAENQIDELSKRAEVVESTLDDIARMRAALSHSQLKRIDSAWELFNSLRDELRRCCQPGGLDINGIPYTLGTRIEMMVELSEVMERLTKLERVCAGIRDEKEDKVPSNGGGTTITQTQIVIFPDGGPGQGHSTLIAPEADTGVLSEDTCG